MEVIIIDEPTHYQCMIPASGSPYLEAYTVLKSSSSGGDSAASGGSGGDDGSCPATRVHQGSTLALVYCNQDGISMWSDGSCQLYDSGNGAWGGGTCVGT